MSLMDITCGDCGARFRLDRELLKGERGARVRCRRCGGPIVVWVPEESPAPPDADVSGAVSSELIPSPPDEKAVPPDNKKKESDNINQFDLERQKFH